MKRDHVDKGEYLIDSLGRRSCTSEMAEQSDTGYLIKTKIQDLPDDDFKKSNLIVCLTGMPGSGKSTVAEFLKEYGFTLVTMGDVIREEAKRSHIALNDTSLGKLMMKMRNDGGPGAIAQLIKKEIEKKETRFGTNNFVVDGIRSLSEVWVLKSIGSVKLLSIHASASVRFEHLQKRGRVDAPLTAQDFDVRDKREVSVGLSEAIALSDEVLSNNSLTLKELKKKSMEIVQRWVEEHHKIKRYTMHSGRPG